MAYNATYETGDMPSIFVDVLGTAGAQVVGFISLIVLLGILLFVIGRLKKIR